MANFDHFSVCAVDIDGFRIGFTRSHFDPVLFPSERQFIPRKQSPAYDTLSVHFRPVSTSEIADEQQSIGADDDTVQLGYAALVNADITQVVLTADESHIAQYLYWASTTKWNELSAHEANTLPGPHRLILLTFIFRSLDVLSRWGCRVRRIPVAIVTATLNASFPVDSVSDSLPMRTDVRFPNTSVRW